MTGADEGRGWAITEMDIDSLVGRSFYLIMRLRRGIVTRRVSASLGAIGRGSVCQGRHSWAARATPKSSRWQSAKAGEEIEDSRLCSSSMAMGLQGTRYNL